ncbi:hypothetical protein [Lysobacter fragariae]
MKTIGCVVLVPLLVTGCASLQQAPLVYVSKVSYGLDVSTTSTESPGIGFNLGYKQVDAAYVPVAVARPCDQRSDMACDGPIYGVQVISGSAHSGKASSDLSADESREKTRQLTEIAGDLNKAKSDLLSAQGEVSTAERRRSELIARHDDARRKHDAISAGSPDATALSDEDNATLASFDEKHSAAELALENARQLVAKREREVENQSSRFATLANEIGGSTQGDSYSVFGSFNAKADAGTSQVASRLGKIFATGVASQNISRGLEHAYTEQATASTSCFNALAVASKSATDMAAVERIAKICAAQSTEPQPKR